MKTNLIKEDIIYKKGNLIFYKGLLGKFGPKREFIGIYLIYRPMIARHVVFVPGWRTTVWISMSEMDKNARKF